MVAPGRVRDPFAAPHGYLSPAGIAYAPPAARAAVRLEPAGVLEPTGWGPHDHGSGPAQRLDRAPLGVETRERGTALVAERRPSRSEPSCAGRTKARGAARSTQALRLLRRGRLVMVGKRLALGVLVGSLGLAAFGGLSSSSGQSQSVSAGCLGWRRQGFRRGLASVGRVAERDPQFRAPVGCERQAVLGSEGLLDRAVHRRGVPAGNLRTPRREVRKNRGRSLQRFEGTRYVETQIVKGTLTDAKVSGTIEGNSVRTKPNGRVVRCTFGPLNWSAVN